MPQWDSGNKRIWSAASSSGEEAFSIAMVLAEHSIKQSWEIVGTDISTRILKAAQNAQYPMLRSKDIPQEYLKKYCLKGIDSEEGTFIIEPNLKSKVVFQYANLKKNLIDLGDFDVIFLRNVMIYFDMETKRHVVSMLLRQLKTGDYLMIGHSESLHGVTSEVRSVVPSIYQKT
ncbi:MAG: hypothetical protein P1U57_08325 [Oleibacter sp.]|nr:hypothetical protein [Thalassolituus sp.]